VVLHTRPHPPIPVTDRVLAAMPVRSDLRQANVFLSYSSKDGAQIQSLVDELEGKHISVWYDQGLIAGQPYRDVLRQRIETVKAVVVFWTENSITSKMGEGRSRSRRPAQ